MILHTSISGEGFSDSLRWNDRITEYEEQSEFFSQRKFRMIRPDLRGHGHSACLNHIQKIFKLIEAIEWKFPIVKDIKIANYYKDYRE